MEKVKKNTDDDFFFSIAEIQFICIAFRIVCSIWKSLKPLPNNPWFSRSQERELLKTLREKEIENIVGKEENARWKHLHRTNSALVKFGYSSLIG